MLKRTSALLALLALLVLSAVAPPAFAQRLDAEVDCKPTKHDLVYECRFVLKEVKSGRLVSGALLSIGADMPSMPMAHNLKPVRAAPGAAPGEYSARIELEMFGDWALKLNVRGPVRDVIVKKFSAREPDR
jgi:hypothetical protein